MVCPVACQRYGKQAAQLLDVAIGIEKVGHQAEASFHVAGEHGNAPAREILRTHAERFPYKTFGLAQREFVFQERIFAAKLLVIAVVGIFLQIVEHSGLSEKQGFYLRERVGMLMQQLQRQAFCEPLESVVVGAEAYGARESDVACRFPIAVVELEQLADAFRFRLKSLESHCLYPFGRF